MACSLLRLFKVLDAALACTYIFSQIIDQKMHFLKTEKRIHKVNSRTNNPMWAAS